MPYGEVSVHRQDFADSARFDAGVDQSAVMARARGGLSTTPGEDRMGHCNASVTHGGVKERACLGHSNAVNQVCSRTIASSRRLSVAAPEDGRTPPKGLARHQ